MTAIARASVETPAAVALGGAGDLAELLAVFWALAPAPTHAGIVAVAGSFGLNEVVDEHISGIDITHDFLPVNGGDVAEVVIIKQPHASFQNICTWEKRSEL